MDCVELSKGFWTTDEKLIEWAMEVGYEITTSDVSAESMGMPYFKRRSPHRITPM